MADHTVFEAICNEIDRDFGILNLHSRDRLKALVEKGMRDAWDRSRTATLKEMQYDNQRTD